MFDQAHRLRQLVKSSESGVERTPVPARKTGSGPSRTKVIVISAGKAGVGKSMVATNVALALAGMRKKVVVAHAGLRGDILNSLYSLGRGDLSAGQRLFNGPSGIIVWDIEKSKGLLHEEIEGMRDQADFIVLDIPSGSLCGMPEVIRAAEDLIVIATPDAESVVEAYAKIKKIVSIRDCGSVKLLVNMALNAGDAQAVRNRLVEVCRHFLKFELECAGSLFFDPLVPKTAQEGGFLYRNHPYCKLSKSLALLAQELCKHTIKSATPERLLQEAVI